jgi:hypothetical protein
MVGGQLPPPPRFRPAPKAPSKQRPLSPTYRCLHPAAPKMTQDVTLDELDTLVQEAAILFQNSASWEDFVPKVRDVHGDFHPNVGRAPHPAAHLINRSWISEAPVICSGVPWTCGQKSTALTRVLTNQPSSIFLSCAKSSSPLFEKASGLFCRPV